MFLQITGGLERLCAVSERTFVRFLAGVYPRVALQAVAGCKRFLAMGATVRFLSSVGAYVNLVDEQ